jgi:hypothetical protein
MSKSKLAMTSKEKVNPKYIITIHSTAKENHAYWAADMQGVIDDKNTPNINRIYYILYVFSMAVPLKTLYNMQGLN